MASSKWLRRALGAAMGFAFVAAIVLSFRPAEAYVEIAYSLGISAGNARGLVSTALRKLGLESRAALYRIAIDQGGVIELTLDDGAKIHVLASAPKRSRLPVADVLSSAELEVAKLAAAGRTNAEIARHRSSSERTVANQMASALRKLGLRSRVELSAHLP